MKKVRLRFTKLVVTLIIVANILLFYYAWKSMLWKNVANSLAAGSADMQKSATALAYSDAAKKAKDKLKNNNKHVRKSITMVFRNIYTFEHDLKATLDSILDVVPNMPIVIVQDGVPYPPLVYERNSTMGEENTVHFFNMAFDLMKNHQQLDPLTVIRTKYVLFMPDSVRLASKNLLQKILREMNILAERHTVNNVVRHMIIIPFMGNLKTFSSCTEIKLDLPNWTIQYTAVNDTHKCDLVSVFKLMFQNLLPLKIVQI